MQDHRPPFSLPVNCPECRSQQPVSLEQLRLGPLTLTCPDCGHGWRVDVREQALEFSRALGTAPRLTEVSELRIHDERGGNIDDKSRHHAE